MSKSKMKWYDWVAYSILSVSAINWGLTVFNYNIVEKLFGGIPFIANGIYLIIGIAGLYSIVTAFKLAL